MFRMRAAGTLLPQPPALPHNIMGHPGPSDFTLNPEHDRHELVYENGAPHHAAVLVPIRESTGEATIILTKRTHTLRSHAGQIAFPGGRTDQDDDSPAMTALREADEEIGLKAEDVAVLGYLESYLTGTGYLVSPVVGIVSPTFLAQPDPGEVAEVFEVPLGFLMNPDNHKTHTRDIAGKSRRFVAIPFGDRYIWGATAGMLKNLYDRVYR